MILQHVDIDDIYYVYYFQIHSFIHVLINHILYFEVLHIGLNRD